ncbi:MAG: trxB [Clostridiales bacterium]|jgi:thioredoxin reductase (NADPH)|nr:trxB [Clostridiales bacterium]
MYDLIIIGSGPAGLAAGIYALRARINCLIIEKEAMSGGQVINTYEVDNYPGMPGINGFDLSIKFREHAEKLGAQFIMEPVKSLEIDGDIKKVITQKDTFETKTILIATGAQWKKLGAKGEDKLQGMGVSYCATCDGAFFRNKVTAVIGGGDVAVEDAIFLARGCKKVYLIHRRDELRATKILQEALYKLDNVEIIWDSVVEEIYGEEKVEGIVVRNRLNNETSNLEIDGVFVAVGTIPNSKLIDGKVEQDSHGYVIAGENCKTKEPGIFAAGDIRSKELRQIITATSDGANAIYSIEKYLYNL